MTREELLDLHRRVSEHARSVMESKNIDYGGNNVFGNLEMCEHMGVAPTEVGILIRMMDKIARMLNFYRNDGFAVPNESLQDCVEDLFNYGVLILAKSSTRPTNA